MPHRETAARRTGIETRSACDLRASLKPAGRIAVIDFRLDAPKGPPKNARIAPDLVKTEMKSAGYALAAEHGFLPNQYFLVFKAAE